MNHTESQAEKIGADQPAQRSRRRRRFWLWLVVVLIALALIGRFAFQFYAPARPEQRVVSTTNPAQLRPVTFPVGTHPTVVINDPFGNIDVHAGRAGTVTINPTEQNPGVSVPPQITYTQNRNNDTITVAIGHATSFTVGVNFDVTVPGKADLQLGTGTGNIDVTGVSGQISLSSTTGTISVIQDSLSGQSNLSDNSGTIIATHDSLSGQSTLSTTVGAISATQDSLSGQSTLSSTTGAINATEDTLSGQATLTTTTSSIRFNGSIDPHGIYLFQSNLGSIGVTLPGNSSFHVDATAGSGSISSTFSGVNIQHPGGSGAYAQGDVGSPPRATVTLRTNSGSISLNKQ